MNEALSPLVWIDLEMTGLNPSPDTILEIATVITDNDLNIIEQGPNLVIYQPVEILSKICEFVKNLHTKTGLLAEVPLSRISLQQAELQTLSFIKKYCQEGKSPLCGNSCWVDRMFLRAWMPAVEQWLFYRNIDVSSIKELALRWGKKVPEKKEDHRALADVYESIDELKFYRKIFFV